MNNNLNVNIALSQCYFLSTHEKNILSTHLLCVEDLLTFSVYDISIIIGRSLKYKNWNPEKLLTKVEKSLKLMSMYNIKMSVNTEINFPTKLRFINNCPFAIYYRGNLSVDDNLSIGIVGTRRPTGKGMSITTNIASELSNYNVVIVSGLALGTDSFAHKGAILKNGETIAVLACGVENIYPKSNSKLAGKILENGGAIVSEYAPGEQPLQYRFPERNRIISGLSDSVLVMEAPERSGSLITAKYALEQSKPLFVCDNLLDSIQNLGIKKILRDGAILIKTSDEIINFTNENKHIKVQNDLFVEEC